MRSKRESEFSEGGCKERREREERDVRGGERELVVESGWTSEGELDQHSVLEVVKLPKRKNSPLSVSRAPLSSESSPTAPSSSKAPRNSNPL